MEELPEDQVPELSKDQLEELNLTKDYDYLLQELVVFAETGISLPVTLTTAAGLVTGSVIGGAEYFDLLRESMLRAFDEGSAQFVNKWIDSYKEIYATPRTEDSPSPTYIHLKNSRVLLGDRFVPTSDGVLWRGKIESIIGFSFGSLSAS